MPSDGSGWPKNAGRRRHAGRRARAPRQGGAVDGGVVGQRCASSLSNSGGFDGEQGPLAVALAQLGDVGAGRATPRWMSGTMSTQGWLRVSSERRREGPLLAVIRGRGGRRGAGGLAGQEAAARGRAALGQGGAAEQRAGAVVAVAVPVLEAVEGTQDDRDAPLARPGEGAERVVDAEPHGGVDVRLAGDAAGEGVGGEVGEHRDGAGDDEARGVVDDVDVQAGRLEQADRLGEGARAGTRRTAAMAIAVAVAGSRTRSTTMTGRSSAADSEVAVTPSHRASRAPDGSSTRPPGSPAAASSRSPGTTATPARSSRGAAATAAAGAGTGRRAR